MPPRNKLNMENWIEVPRLPLEKSHIVDPCGTDLACSLSPTTYDQFLARDILLGMFEMCLAVAVRPLLSDYSISCQSSTMVVPGPWPIALLRIRQRPSSVNINLEKPRSRLHSRLH